jgi:arylsulfatase A-like enzyme
MAARLLALVVSCAVLGCAGQGPPNVVVVLIDTLRADHVGAYGHPKVQTPALDRLAREGILFERAFTVVPTTLSSTASLFTAQHPRTHGVPRNHFVLDDAAVTLAETLRSAGYATVGFAAAVPLSGRTNISQGFERWDDELGKVGSLDMPQRRGRRVTNAVLRWLSTEEARPYFLFVHYFDPHFPYDPPRQFRERYSSGYDGTIDISPGSLKKLRAALQRGEDRAAEVAERRARYMGEVTYVDREIGRLVDALRERGDLERTLLVVLSDHGETFEEHELDYFNHGRAVYDTTLRIPLIFRLPQARNAGRRVPSLVRTIDVAPTLHEMLGLPAPRGVEGRSFAAMLEGGADDEERALFAEATLPREEDLPEGWRNARKAKCMRTARWKYVWIPYLDREEVFDLDSDPLEQRNLLDGGSASAEAARVARELRSLMSGFTSGQAAHAEELGEELRDALRALGYLD